MHEFVGRSVQSAVLADLRLFPAVALLGPRQAGKSTLALEIAKGLDGCVYLDLENEEDRARLSNPGLYFGMYAGSTVILDEVQSLPSIFPVLRSVIDRDRRPGRFLLLGSASRQLVNQSSESLAGRIGYIEMSGFLPDECPQGRDSLFTLLSRGGFPDSYLAGSDSDSYRWRQAFIRSYVERDLPLLGLGAPPPLIRRLWTMAAHLQGQLLNGSTLAASLGTSATSVRRYLDFMEDALLVRLLPPWSGNLKKRLTKSPKLYLRDSGIAHALLSVKDRDEMMGHPGWGAQWEAVVVESCLRWCFNSTASYYRTSNGTEVDLVLESGGHRVIVEAKASLSPVVGKGFWTTLADLNADAGFICAPVDSMYPLAENVFVVPIVELKQRLMDIGFGD